MSAKVDFVKHLQKRMTELAAIVEQDLPNVYFDRTYNSGGADAITDADVSSTGLTATQVGSVITLLQQLENFVGNSAVTQGDYKLTINVARTDIVE